MASENVTKIVEEFKTLTVLELSELVSAVEEEFGVAQPQQLLLPLLQTAVPLQQKKRPNLMLFLQMLARTRFRLLRLLRKQQVSA